MLERKKVLMGEAGGEIGENVFEIIRESGKVNGKKSEQGWRV